MIVFFFFFFLFRGLENAFTVKPLSLQDFKFFFFFFLKKEEEKKRKELSEDFIFFGDLREGNID